MQSVVRRERNEAKLKRLISKMIEEASFERPEDELVEESCSAVKHIIECIANSMEFKRTGLDKKRWYNTSVFTSSGKVAYQCSLEEPGPPPSPHNCPY